MESVAITDSGRQREINQDYVYSSNESIGLLQNLYIVADGMGGHKAGDFASRFCVDEFIKELSNTSGRTEIGAMSSAIKATNDALLHEAEANPDLEGMGTTFVAATFVEDSIYVTNVGDSRLYLYNKEHGLCQITEDHSLVEEMIRNGEIERKDAKHHPKKNVITRALGVAKNVVPDFFEKEVREGDYCLLCSDGLTNMLDDSFIVSILTDEKMSLKQKAERLILEANEQGGKDNISVVLIHV